MNKERRLSKSCYFATLTYCFIILGYLVTVNCRHHAVAFNNDNVVSSAEIIAPVGLITSCVSHDPREAINSEDNSIEFEGDKGHFLILGSNGYIEAGGCWIKTTIDEIFTLM